MALSGTAAKLLASLDLDTKPFERGEKRVGGSLGRMESGMSKISTRAIALGAAAGVAIERIAEKGISVLFGAIRDGEEGLRVLQDTQAQTQAVIQSTGAKAGVTAQQIRAMAEAQEDLTTVDDKVIQSGENLLLTFTGIGKNVFPQATKAMVDMAVAMNGGNAEGIDLKSTAIQIGKALNDPIRGVTALRRVGVQLTDQQEKQIKKLVKLGKVEDAQKIILKELQTEFGKAGEAAGKSGAAGVRRLADAVEDTKITLATGLAPALDRIRGKITEALKDPGTQAAVKHLGEWLGDAAEKGLQFATKIPWGQVGDGLKTAAGFVGKVIDAFANMPPQVQGTILALAGLNKLTGGGVIKVGVDIFKEGAGKLLGGFFQRGSSPANPMFVAGTGIGGGASGVAGGASTLTKVAALAAGAIIIPEVLSAVQEQFINPRLQEQAGRNITSTEAVIATGNQTEQARALQQIRDNVASLDGIQKILYDLNANGVKTHTESLEAALIAAIDESSKATTASLQPLPEKISAKQRAQFDTLRDRIEGSRIATVTAQHGTTTQMRQSGLGIEKALKAIDLKQTFVINLPKPGTFTYQTGGTISKTKITRLEKLAAT